MLAPRALARSSARGRCKPATPESSLGLGERCLAFTATVLGVALPATGLAFAAATAAAEAPHGGRLDMAAAFGLAVDARAGMAGPMLDLTRTEAEPLSSGVRSRCANLADCS